MSKDDLVRFHHMLDAALEIFQSYYDIDLDRVWDTVVEDIPPLASDLQKIIEEIEKK